MADVSLNTRKNLHDGRRAGRFPCNLQETLEPKRADKGAPKKTILEPWAAQALFLTKFRAKISYFAAHKPARTACAYSPKPSPNLTKPATPMDSISEFFRFMLNSEDIIRYGGLVLVAIIIFAENGLFFAFFLPGDYLLFLSGLFCSTRQLDFPIYIVVVCIIVAAVLGSYVGYYFGRALGRGLENRPDSFFFKRRNLDQSRSFFARYGSRALILARFMPVLRTFSPIIAGTIRMPVPTFSLYNVVGGVIWGTSLPLAGYFLGHSFPQIIDYVHYIIIFFLVITTYALVRTWLSVRRQERESGRESQK